MMRSPRGFATVLFLSLLPVLLAGGLALYCLFGFLKSDLGTLNVCRARQIEVQNKVGRNLAKLLKLNPRALKLRLEEARAQKSLAAAIDSGAAPAIMAAEAYLLSVQMRRQSLHLRQRALIDTADLWLTSAGTTLPSELRQEWQHHNGALTAWLQNSIQVLPPQTPKLAVQADLPEVAPVYLLAPNFAEAQAWKQSWSLRLATSGWAQNFLTFNGGFDRSCITSLYADGAGWIGRLKKDKSSLKGFL